MPYPILLAVGAAAAAAGAGMQMAAQSESKSAMNDARNAELLRQQGYQQRAEQTAAASIGQSTRPVAQQQMDQGTDARKAEQSKLAAVIPGAQSSNLPGQNSNVTGNAPGGPGSATAKANATASQTANAWSKLVGDASAKLGGYEDWGVRQNIKNAEANQRLGIINNEARGSASVLPIEMEAASHKGDELAGWGQLVGALGSVAGGAGAVGMGPMIGASGAATAGGGAAVDAAAASGSLGYSAGTAGMDASPWSSVYVGSLA